jgi:manganese/zinc/iron transport system substrate-binding protein
MIADAAKNIAGPEIEVKALMGPGVDPHLYKATTGDLATLRKADIIFYNGLHLEGKMSEVFQKLAQEKAVFAVSEKLPEERLMHPPGNPEAHDPHIWFDVSLWMDACRAIGSRLMEMDPDRAAVYQQNMTTYLDSLRVLDGWVRERIQEIPESGRVLITAHDAFGYFGRAYDIEVRGLQGISTVAEFGLKDVKELVDFICQRQIRSVFIESSIPAKSLEAVVEGCRNKGHDVKIGGTLFSDAMGNAGTPEGSYTGMVRANVITISNGLK